MQNLECIILHHFWNTLQHIFFFQMLKDHPANGTGIKLLSDFKLFIVFKIKHHIHLELYYTRYIGNIQ